MSFLIKNRFIFEEESKDEIKEEIKNEIKENPKKAPYDIKNGMIMIKGKKYCISNLMFELLNQFLYFKYIDVTEFNRVKANLVHNHKGNEGHIKKLCFNTLTKCNNINCNFDHISADILEYICKLYKVQKLNPCENIINIGQNKVCKYFLEYIIDKSQSDNNDNECSCKNRHQQFMFCKNSIKQEGCKYNDCRFNHYPDLNYNFINSLIDTNKIQLKCKYFVKIVPEKPKINTDCKIYKNKIISSEMLEIGQLIKKELHIASIKREQEDIDKNNKHIIIEFNKLKEIKKNAELLNITKLSEEWFNNGYYLLIDYKTYKSDYSILLKSVDTFVLKNNLLDTLIDISKTIDIVNFDENIVKIKEIIKKINIFRLQYDKMKGLIFEYYNNFNQTENIKIVYYEPIYNFIELRNENNEKFIGKNELISWIAKKQNYIFVYYMIDYIDKKCDKNFEEWLKTHNKYSLSIEFIETYKNDIEIKYPGKKYYELSYKVFKFIKLYNQTFIENKVIFTIDLDNFFEYCDNEEIMTLWAHLECNYQALLLINKNIQNYDEIINLKPITLKYILNCDEKEINILKSYLLDSGWKSKETLENYKTQINENWVVISNKNKVTPYFYLKNHKLDDMFEEKNDNIKPGFNTDLMQKMSHEFVINKENPINKEKPKKEKIIKKQKIVDNIHCDTEINNLQDAIDQIDQYINENYKFKETKIFSNDFDNLKNKLVLYIFVNNISGSYRIVCPCNKIAFMIKKYLQYKNPDMFLHTTSKPVNFKEEDVLGIQINPIKAVKSKGEKGQLKADLWKRNFEMAISSLLGINNYLTLPIIIKNCDFGEWVDDWSPLTFSTL